MRTCLVLGGADTLHDDLARYSGPVDGVVACNDAGAEWSGRLDAWVSLHPRFFEAKGWRERRAERGYPAAAGHYCHASAKEPVAADVIRTAMELPGQAEMFSGSSGLFAAKVALIDLGFDMAVLCGVPMTAAPHFHGADHWTSARGKSPALGFRRAWLQVAPEYRGRMRSMSGWTRILLGGPSDA